MQSRNILVNAYVKNILIALVILMALIFIVLQGLSVYTHHGKQVDVPDVKGMQVEQAVPFLIRKSLHYEIVDSMHVRNKPAGSILETVPPVGTNVKEGRTIYLTVNSITSRMLTVPQLLDDKGFPSMSQRQAEAMLRSLGFETIRIRLVPESGKDLTVGLQTAEGTALVAGNRIPANTSLVLLVSSGERQIYVPNDSITIPEDPEEY